MAKLFYTLVFVFSSFGLFAQQQQPVSILKLESRVIDLANLFSLDQKKSLFQLMEQLENKVGSQIAIITVETLYGQPINEYARSHANQLGLGRKKYKDGLLIVFAINDGLLRTEVGQGLSKIITNEISDGVNQTVMAPLFREHNYWQGFYNGIKAYSEKIEANENLIGEF